MKKLLLIPVLVLSAMVFSIAFNVGIGFNLDMSSGSLETPVFAELSVGTPLIRGVVQSYIFSFNWSSFVVKGYSILDHSSIGLVATPGVFNNFYVRLQLYWSLSHLFQIIEGSRKPQGTPLYSRIGFGSYIGKFMLDGGFAGYWILEPFSAVPFARPYLALNYSFSTGVQPVSLTGEEF